MKPFDVPRRGVAALLATFLAATTATMFVDLQTGGEMTCGRTAAGVVQCWGYAVAGSIGSGNPDSTSYHPYNRGKDYNTVQLPNGRHAINMAVGRRSVCVILDNRDVVCWGQNWKGELGIGNLNRIGDGTNEMGNNLQTVPMPSGATPNRLYAGQYTFCVQMQYNDDLYCWGYNEYGQCGRGSGGHNVGDSAATVSSYMGDSWQRVWFGSGGKRSKMVTAGRYHICAIRTVDDEVVCWGAGDKGQLGTGNTNNVGDGPNEMSDYLVPVDFPGSLKAKTIASGERHNCAITTDDNVYCWGYAYHGQLGTGQYSNNIGNNMTEMGDNLQRTDIGSGKKAFAICTGRSHTCAIRMGAKDVVCWGITTEGQHGRTDYPSMDIGDTPGEMGDNLVPVNLGPGRHAESLHCSGSGDHTCAILDDGNVVCWGANQYGQLGIGHVYGLTRSRDFSIKTKVTCTQC